MGFSSETLNHTVVQPEAFIAHHLKVPGSIPVPEVPYVDALHRTS